jgi:hypothetical protein
MRDLVGFAIFCTIVFFAVGETVGWNVGFPGSTPVFVYKRDAVATVERRTVTRTDMPVAVSGLVRRGEVEVTVVYQDMGSFQTNRSARPPETVYQETFRLGQRVVVDEVFRRGAGRYEVTLIYRDASGTFRIELPPASQL